MADKIKKNVKTEEPKQLDLGIKEPFQNKFFKLKGKVDLFILRFEVRKFLKDPLVWGILVVSLILILHQAYMVSENIDKFPTYLPIFKYYLNVADKLMIKEYAFIYPVISASVFVTSFFIISRYYNKERSLTKFLLLGILLTSLSQSIILIDIINSF